MVIFASVIKPIQKLASWRQQTNTIKHSKHVVYWVTAVRLGSVISGTNQATEPPPPCWKDRPPAVPPPVQVYLSFLLNLSITSAASIALGWCEQRSRSLFVNTAIFFFYMWTRKGYLVDVKRRLGRVRFTEISTSDFVFIDLFVFEVQDVCVDLLARLHFIFHR